MMKRAAAAAAAMFVGLTALTGAAATTGSATAVDAKEQHSKKLVLRELASQDLSRRTFAGADKVKSAASGELVGYDSYTGKYYPRKQKAVLQVALALKGGIIVARVSATFTSDSPPPINGRILKGTGKYKGIDGTVSGRLTESDRVPITLNYRL